MTTSHGTITLRCQECDNKLAPARGFYTNQVIRRTCNECGRLWKVTITPDRTATPTVLYGREGTVFRLHFEEVST